MVPCILCNGYGRIDYEYYNEQCTNCDGTGKVPKANYLWRPYEPAKDTPVEKSRSCNLHVDCDEADARVRASGGRQYGVTGLTVQVALHCDAEDCEDCFGC